MKVGEYVRVEDGGIGKIKEINQAYHQRRNNKVFTDNDTISTGWDGESVEWCFNEEIIKTSPNIIDLIEVGDVITTNNLCGEITKIDGDKIYTTCYDGEYCSASDIKSVVTKEQFEAMEYKCE